MNPADPSFPTVGRDQMAALDRAMIDDLHISLVQMMENAGRALAQLAWTRFLGENPAASRVVVLAGKGGNGGGALVGARNLSNWGTKLLVALARPEADLAPVTALQLTILRRLEMPIVQASQVADLPPADLIIDGLVGYSLSGPPLGTTATLVRWANAQPAQVLALDLPTGLDADTGNSHDPTVRAAATLTLAIPKTGLRAPKAGPNVGELYLADIGVPTALARTILGDSALKPLFTGEAVIRVW